MRQTCAPRECREISWEEWFAKFDSSKLAFLYQEQVKSGDESRFFKLVNR